LALIAVELFDDPEFFGDLGLSPMRIGFHILMLQLTLSSTGLRTQCKVMSDYIFTRPESERGYWQNWAARLGGFSVTQRAMRRYMDDPDALHACAQFFCAMANFNREASLHATESGAIETLLESMKKFPYHAGLQAQGSASMGCWCDWTPENERKVARLGGPDVILKAINSFPADVNVQFLGWAGLSSVSNELSSKRLIVEAGAISSGMKTMRDPELSKGYRVRQEIIMTFCNLAANCNDCVNDMLATGDIIEQVKQAMDEEVDTPDAQRGTKTDGIQLMMEFAKNNRTTRRTIIDSGFINYTLQGMKQFPQRHPQDAWPLCEFALTLLTSLVEEEGAAAKMKAAGAAAIVQLAMDSHRTPERMVMGQKLLRQIRSA